MLDDLTRNFAVLFSRLLLVLHQRGAIEEGDIGAVLDGREDVVGLVAAVMRRLYER